MRSPVCASFLPTDGGDLRSRYGEPKRAHSWKRRIQPREAYSAPELLCSEVKLILLMERMSLLRAPIRMALTTVCNIIGAISVVAASPSSP